jgi:hypothetical protein
MAMVCRARAAAVLLLSLRALVGQVTNCSSDGGGQCLVRGPSPSDPQLRLPVSGEDICEVLAQHCGGGREGAMCVKAALGGLLPRSAGHMSAIFEQMRVPREFYLLCSPPGFATELSGSGRGAATSERVVALTEMLHRASNSSREAPGSPQAAQLLYEYQHTARWSELERQGWTPRDKIVHFLDVLASDPQRRIHNGLAFLHLHVIDRLATALDEAAAESAAHEGREQETAMLRRGRALLLHYAVLSELILHPLQRPLSIVRGLRPSAWWPTTTATVRVTVLQLYNSTTTCKHACPQSRVRARPLRFCWTACGLSQVDSSADSAPGSAELLPWLEPFLRPANLAAMQVNRFLPVQVLYTGRKRFTQSPPCMTRRTYTVRICISSLCMYRHPSLYRI